MTTYRSLTRAALLMALPILFVAVRLLLRGCPSRMLRWGLSADRRSLPPLAAPALTARAVAGAVRWLPFQPTCLEQACVVLLLAGRGARLVVGIAGTHAQLRAHAWVEHDGRVILGAAGLAGMTPFPSWTPARADRRVEACRA